MIRSITPLRRNQPTPSPIDLRSVIAEHNNLLKTIEDKRSALQQLHDESSQAHQDYLKEVKNRLAQLDATIAEMRLIQKGDKGETGDDGESVEHEQVVADVLKKVPTPKN